MRIRRFLSIYWLLRRLADLVAVLPERKKRPRLELKQISSILIVMSNGIGDMVMFTPVLHALKSLFPNSTFTIVCPLGQRKLLEENVGFRHIEFREEMTDRIFLPIAIQLMRGNFSMAFSGSCYPGKTNALLAWLSGAGIRVGPIHRNLYTHHYVPRRVSNVENNLVCLSILGLPIRRTEPRLQVDSSRVARQKSVLTAFSSAFRKIAIHPGCDTKREYCRWPEEKFAELLDMLLVYDPRCRAAIIEGPDEQGIAKSIQAKTDNLNITIVSQLDISDVAAFLTICDVVITSDSGLGHVSTALGVPTVSIFGPADEVRTAPYGQRSRIVSKDLECRPCFSLFRTHCPRGDRVCLNAIHPQDVYKATIETFGYHP